MSVITEPSICIPRTLNNVTWRIVKDTFETLIGPGTVDRVDIVKSNGDNQQFCRIFVHFRYWPVKTPASKEIRDRLVSGETIKIVYDSPWFWKCVTSRISKPERTAPKIAPFVEFLDKQVSSDEKDDASEKDEKEEDDASKKDEKEEEKEDASENVWTKKAASKKAASKKASKKMVVSSEE